MKRKEIDLIKAEVARLLQRIDEMERLAGWGTPQPVVREPLTDEWIRSRCKEPWVFETAKQWVRMAEAAHGINKGGLHGTE